MEKKMICGYIADTPTYSPPGHEGTVNRRLLAPFNGCQDAEIIYGEMTRGGEAKSHVHEDYDQIVITLEGEFQAKSDDQEFTHGAGSYLLIPRGVRHASWCISEKARFFVIYTPPRQRFESGQKGERK